MKTYNVFHKDKFLAACEGQAQANRFVANHSGKRSEWAIRYEGYQIKHGIAPKFKGAK